jgi:tetratricopeptide (TPR) repeat protein
VPFVPGALSDVISQPLVGLNAFGQEMLAWFVPFGQRVMYAPVTGFSGYAPLGIVFLGLLLFGAIRQMRRAWSASSSHKPQATSDGQARQVALGCAWTVLFLLPFAQLVPWGPSGRMLYLSGFGVVLAALASFAASPERAEVTLQQSVGESSHRPRTRRAKAIAVGLAAVYCVALGAWTVKRNALWRDEATLYRATVLEAPESQCAHLYLADSLQNAGETVRSVSEYRAALELDPDLVGAHHRLGNILMELDDIAEAIEEYREVVRLNSSALAHHLLAQAWTRAGRLDSATAELREVVRRQPDIAAAHTELALNLVRRDLLDSALVEFRLAVRLDSMSAETHNNLALAFRQSGMPDSAIREYEKSLTLDPKSHVTLGNLGSAKLALGDRPGAAASFRLALVLKPDFSPARDGLAQALRE